MKKNSACCLFGAMLVILPVFCFSQDDASVISCSGTVYENASQKPLNGAKIRVTNTEKNTRLADVTSNQRGGYSFILGSPVNIKIEVTLSGYKKAEKKFTKGELNQYKWRLPGIYLDTTIKLDIKPTAPVRQSKEDYVDGQLQSLDVLPTKDAYDLLVYLNPDLNRRDSLMSNDKIILPKIPRISQKAKRDNKDPFQAAKKNDGTTQNRLRDTLDKVARILSEDITRYNIRFENTSAASMTQMRQYIREDLLDYRSEISGTSKLKAEGIIELMSKMGQLQESMITQRALRAMTYETMKMTWEDLSYLLEAQRYMYFVNSDKQPPGGATNSLLATNYYYTTDEGSEEIRMASVPVHDEYTPIGSPVFFKDEVGFFGFLVWSETLTSPTRPDLSEPGSRYLIRYFKPALAADTLRYKECIGAANVATANLTRARYGIQVYDTKERKYVETVEGTVATDAAFINNKYDAWFTPDFKEIKYIMIHLK